MIKVVILSSSKHEDMLVTVDLRQQFTSATSSLHERLVNNPQNLLCHLLFCHVELGVARDFTHSQ